MTGVPVTARELAARVDGLRDAVAGRAKDEEVAGKLSGLHRLLLGPVLLALRPGDRILFVPDRVLHRVPFAALLDPATRRYLVEDHGLGVAPSASLAVEATPRPGGGGPSLDVFVVADPDFDREEFPGLSRLKDARREGVFLKELFAGRGLFLDGNAASSRRVLEEAGRHAILHIATHALVNPDHPHLSKLVLAPDAPGDPGTLTAAEVQGLDLSQTRLVFLGACRSGEGKVASEGVLSLARAFQAAGAPEVVASLWDLEDADAAALSADFYRRFVRRPDAVAALREAQLEALRRTGRRASQLARWAGLQVAARAGNSH
jgi:CHAT domain-containing protein